MPPLSDAELRLYSNELMQAPPRENEAWGQIQGGEGSSTSDVDSEALLPDSRSNLTGAVRNAVDVAVTLNNVALQLEPQLAFSSQANSTLRRTRPSVPPTQLECVFGRKLLRTIAEAFAEGYKGRHVRWQGGGTGEDQRVLYLDVRRFLDAETAAAYEMLADHQELMGRYIIEGDLV